MKKVEKTAKNLEDALSLAAEELCVTVEELGYEIIQEVGKGLLGFLVGKEVTVSAWKKADEPKVAPARNESKPEKVKPAKTAAKTEKSGSAVKKADAKAEPAPEPAPVKKAEEKVTHKNSKRPSAEVTEDMAESLKAFLSELLNKMGIQNELKTSISGDTINVDVSGERMGLLIGKRGDTLDSVQYLTNLYVNKGKEGYVKVIIDTENYRQKREETLVRLAHSLERKVLSGRKSLTLEPMSPYERRIIHAALQGNDKIKTYSVGDEPNRKIVVTLA